MRMSKRKKMSSTVSKTIVGGEWHGSSSQYKAIMGGVRTAMYARNAMLMASQASPNLERGCINLELGMPLAGGEALSLQQAWHDERFGQILRASL